MQNSRDTMCSRCFRSFASQRDNFYYNATKGKYYSMCKECHKKNRRERGYKPPKNRVTKPLSSDPTEAKFISMRRSIASRHKRKEWTGDIVTTSELLEIHKNTGGVCYYTGLSYEIDKDAGPLKMSIDRVDSTVGYTKENVVLCCWFVNCAKNEWSLDTMKDLWKHLPVNA